MIKTTCRNIEKYVGGRIIYGDPDTPIIHMTTDSRSVPGSALFIPIKGANADGHRFIEGALKNGAAAFFTEHPESAENYKKDYPDSVAIEVSDTTEALQSWAREARRGMSIPAVGVTGSVGKTTTREMIACALGAEKKVYRTGKNYNNWLGVPTTLLDMTDDDDIAVLELGMNVPGELGLISSLCRLDTAVITNIGVAHIEFYGSQEKICEEKFTVTRGFEDDDDPAEKRLFLNADDPYLVSYADKAGYPVTFYGSDERAEYRAADIRIEDGITTFDLFIRGSFFATVRLSVLGRHNALNAAAAFAVADHYGVDLNKVCQAISTYTGFKGRLQQTKWRGALIIDDAYNANPVSMKGGLDVAEEAPCTGKRTVILGDMFELGPNSAEYHREVGSYAAGKKIDRLFLVGTMSENIEDAARENGASFEIRHFDSREEIAEILRKDTEPGDLIYLKASNGMKLQEITEELLK